MEYTRCLLCQTPDYEPYLTLGDTLLGLPGTFRLVRCTGCGLVYQNPRPTPAEIGAYYPPDYDPFVAPPWANPNLVLRLLHLYGLKKRWRVVERHAPARAGRRRILDVGCATGVFLGAGSDGWQAEGVELSAEAAALARQQFGLTVHEGLFDTLDLPPHSFDVVTMWDVLEHVHDPRATLAHVHRLLRPDGIFVARVPNLDAWDARLWGPNWAGLDQPRHLFVPGEATLSALLTQASFAECERLCLSGTYGVQVLSWRFWLAHHVANVRLRRVLYRLGDNLLMRLALAPLLWAVDKRFRKGSLLVVVARPQPA